MAHEQLQDISKRADFKEITAKGGRNVTEAQILSRKIDKSHIAKCKNCKLKCDFREAQLLKDSENVCIVPDMRGRAIYNGTAVIAMNDERILGHLTNILKLYEDVLVKGNKFEVDPKKLKIETIKDLNVMYNRLLQFKQAYHPPTHKSVNINVTTTADKIIERIRTYKIQEVKEQNE